MTETSRRTLLRASAVGLLAAPLADAGAAFAAPRSSYRRSRYLPFVGRSFWLVDATGRWRVRLTAIDDLPHAVPGDDEQYGLTLSRLRPGPPQGTYSLQRDGVPSTPMFVVPSSADRRTYQVVVNRL